MKKLLYFAYGSNLSRYQMRTRCPDAVGVSTATLENWNLVQRTYADIDQCPNAFVNGALYEISADDLAALDRYEGYPEFYTRLNVLVCDNTGTYRKAIVYTMTERYKKALDQKPFAEKYRSLCSRGARDWGIPDAFASDNTDGMHTIFPDEIPDVPSGIDRMFDFLDSQAPLPRAKKLWIGAKIVITLKKQNIEGAFGFYPAPFQLTTPHAQELSWVFAELRTLFWKNKLLDGMNRFYFFDRLASRADNVLRDHPKIDARTLCREVVQEAKKFYGEIKQGSVPQED